MTIAIVPTSGRHEIIRVTIPRLLKQVDKVIIAGDNEDEYISGSDFYVCPLQMKLGAKWQFCLERAKEYNPDFVLISSSGGIFSDSYFDLPIADVSGSAGIYYLDIQPEGKRMIYWPGYLGSRSDEPVGLGRAFSSGFLDKCKWRIFETKANSGIDFLTMNIVIANEGKVVLRNNPPIRLSSYKYKQKDPFDRILKMNNTVKINDIKEKLKDYGINSDDIL